VTQRQFLFSELHLQLINAFITSFSTTTTTTIIVIVVVFQGLGLLACSGSELIF
jgi:hypothetical protein